jgi:hypothetical protein
MTSKAPTNIINFIKLNWKNLKGLTKTLKNSKNCAYQTFIGIIMTPISLATLGREESINKLADRIGYSRDILSLPYIKILKIIKPKIKFKKYSNHLEKHSDMGLTTTLLVKPLFEKASKLADLNKNRLFCKLSIYPKSLILKKYLASRALFISGALLALTTRVIDLVLGLFSALLVVFTRAKRDKLNKFALRNLTTFPNIAIDISCYGLRASINPFQFKVETQK